MIVVRQENRTVQFSCLDDLVDGVLTRLLSVMARASRSPSVFMRSSDKETWTIRVVFPKNEGATVYLTEIYLVFTEQYEVNRVYEWLRHVEVACLRAGPLGMASADLIALLARYKVCVDTSDPGAIRQWTCAIEALEALGYFPGISRSRRREQIVIGLIQELQGFSAPMQTVCLVLARWEATIHERAKDYLDQTLLHMKLCESLFDECSGLADDPLGEDFNPLGI